MRSSFDHDSFQLLVKPRQGGDSTWEIGWFDMVQVKWLGFRFRVILRR